MPTLVARSSQQFQTALNTWKGASKSMLEWNINSAMIKPKYTQLISSCPAPLSFSFPVSSHHPIFLSSTSSIFFLFILLISMPCLVNFLPHRDHNSFSERAKISKKLPTQNSTQNAFLFLSGDIYSGNLSLQRSSVEWSRRSCQLNP